MNSKSYLSARSSLCARLPWLGLGEDSIPGAGGSGPRRVQQILHGGRAIGPLGKVTAVVVVGLHPLDGQIVNRCVEAGLLGPMYLGVVGAALAVAARRPGRLRARVRLVEDQAHALGAHALLFHKQPHETHVLELLLRGQGVAYAVRTLLVHRAAHNGSRALEPTAATARLTGVHL
jgi:hypothetical protein